MTLRDAWSMARRRAGGARVREFARFAASTALYQGARFLFSLAAARALNPEDFVTWALVVALLVYAPSHLGGVTNGMARELPILVGRGAVAHAERSMDAAWAATITAVGLILLGCAIAAAAASGVASVSFAIGTLACGTIVFGTQQFIMRSNLRFDAASAQQAILGMLILISSALLVSRQAPDFLFAAILFDVSLVLAVLFGLTVAPPLRLRFDPAELWRLARIGFPIMLAGLVFSVFVTLDRWMAVTLLGSRDAAPYALASLIAAGMLIIPTVVSQQTYPRMAIARGRGASPDELRAMARRQGSIASALVAPIALGLVAFAWLGIPSFLPAYAAAAPAVVALTIGLVVLAYFTGYGNYLNVAGGQWRYLGTQLIGIGFAAGLMVLGALAFGLVGIGLGMAGGHLLYGALLREVSVRTDLLDVSTGIPVGSRSR